jgi:hypothetical protein
MERVRNWVLLLQGRHQETERSMPTAACRSIAEGRRASGLDRL